MPGLVNAVEYCLQLLSHLCPCLLPSLYTPRGPFLSPCLLPSLRRRYLKETNPESAWILSCLFGVFRLQLLFGKGSPKAALTPLWGQTCSINSLLRPAIFLFIMPVASLKMALSVGDTGKAFSRFLKIRLLEWI